MKAETDNNTLTLYLTGRIDADNSAKIDSEISQALTQNPGLVPVFDASGLEYISSAGLRVLLKFRKQFGKNLDVLNVSGEVYEIFEVTGFTELLNVKKRLREISLESLEIIGGGAFSTVYRLDPETIVKVFTHPSAALETAEKDRMISREVFLHDIPTAIAYDVVKAGDKYGLVYEMINADTVTGTLQKHPERLKELSIKMAGLMKKIHTTEFKPGTFPDARDIMHKFMQLTFSKGFITAEDKAIIDGAIDRIPSRNTFVHFDYHAKNVMLSSNELILIDVGDAGLGHPIFDFMAAYAHFVRISRFAERVYKGHEKAMGLDYKTLRAMWDIMFPEYFGTTDKDTLKRYDEVISDYSSIMMLYMLCHSPMPDDIHPKVAASFAESLRKVLPDLKTIKGF